MTEQSDNHRRSAGAFSERVAGVGARWDDPTPVPEWTVRDIVRHLVEWLPGFLASGSTVRLPAGPSVDDDPAGAWRAHCSAVQAVLDDPAIAGEVLANPHIGELPVADAIDRFYTPDVFMHTWDLARATGQDDRLDAEMCAAMLAGLQPIDQMLRDSGQYGPRKPVADDAPAVDRLMAFIGRDPDWRPSATRGTGPA
jgi:uncharacterized protein (TIGR03086 family)